MKLSWDIPFPEGIAKRWLRRKNNASDDVYFPRSPVQYYEPNDSIKLPALVMQVITVCVLLCILWLHKCQV